MWLECVPNFSEGCDTAVIRAIAAAIESVAEVRLLGVDPGISAHRTVMTFAGPPDAVVEAAFRSIRTAAERIDMTTHSGAHPRMGATDVCPLIPLHGVDIETAVAAAHRLARRVGDELSIPVYLYEAAAKGARTNLADLRRGEYEGLAEKLTHPACAPDYGPAQFNAQSGATVIGVRDLLIAWNVDLTADSLKASRRIAARIRESGRMTRQGRVLGVFKGLKAIGWHMAQFGHAQVSMNLTRAQLAPMHEVFELISQLAAQYDTRVTGSELVGLVPGRALVEAGRHFGGEAGRDWDEQTAMAHAARVMGLGTDKPFALETHVLEQALGLDSLLPLSVF